MNGQPRQWGLTPPMSTAHPTPEDVKQNQELIQELVRENNYEGQAETQKRMATLRLLNNTVVEFVKEVSRSMHIPRDQIEQFGGKVFAYGSYRLGVYGPGSDIDTLAVAPQHIKREDFFKHFPGVLRRLAPSGAITSLTAVPDSFVPIIKLVLNNIEIDLIFVAIESKRVIPKDLTLNDNRLLDGLDQASIRAITGPRVTDEILSLVPEAKTFRTALRAIKIWAQRRAIYANIVGYPGGVAWAMLVARVCQMYPHALGSLIILKFFRIIKDWRWPQPLMLNNPETGKEKQWNPSIYPGDRKNIMPIITPAYPCMCATYNISKSGKTIILRELERGDKIANDIFDPKSPTTWKDLFQKHSFFTKDHKYYLSVITASHNQEAAKAWSGLVESKVRHLVMSLELLSEMINLARPFTKGFKRVHRFAGPEQLHEVRHGSMKHQIEETQTVETTDPELVTTNGEGAAVPEARNAQPEVASGGPQTLYTITFYVGVDITDKATKNLNISQATNYFEGICRSWPNYNDNIHWVKVVPCKSYELPEDLFDKKVGEARPTKPEKKKKATLKRSFDAVEEPATNGSVKRHELSTPTDTALQA